MTNTWEAVYEDGTSLKQFNDSGEALFKDIQQDKLQEFRLLHNGRVISLFLKTGTFGINGLLYNTPVSNQKLDYRLIYFARRRRNMGCGGNAELSKDSYYIGFQANDGDKCHKHMISVCDYEIEILSE